VGYENEINERGERLIWLDPLALNRLRAMRGPGESYSDVILRRWRARARHSLAGPRHRGAYSQHRCWGCPDRDMRRRCSRCGSCVDGDVSLLRRLPLPRHPLRLGDLFGVILGAVRIASRGVGSDDNLDQMFA
jgi:hypothetical protein